MRTTVHLLRHGEVHNPTGILYGRRPGYFLSDLGQQMAQRVADTIGDRDIRAVWSSPLERAQQTAQPTADALGLEIRTDDRLIESTNRFEGEIFRLSDSIIKRPHMWRFMWNPWKPSWGEPYKEVVARMMAAVHDAREAVEGHEVVLVSHQLPIWITRLRAEGRPFLHNPRSRSCTLCSLTSLIFEDERLVELTYSEPAGDLIPVTDRKDPFSAGGDPAAGPPGSAPGGAGR